MISQYIWYHHDIVRVSHQLVCINMSFFHSKSLLLTAGLLCNTYQFLGLSPQCVCSRGPSFKFFCGISTFLSPKSSGEEALLVGRVDFHWKLISPFMLFHCPLNNLDTYTTSAIALRLSFDHTVRAQAHVGSHRTRLCMCIISFDHLRGELTSQGVGLACDETITWMHLVTSLQKPPLISFL